MATASDYDARHVSDVETQDRSALRELAPTLPGSSTTTVEDDPDVYFLEPPGADLSGEELSVMTVIPQRADEFTCSSCFLVQHRSRMRTSSSGLPICADCA
jgi:hypothetical protein